LRFFQKLVESLALKKEETKMAKKKAAKKKVAKKKIVKKKKKR